MAVIWVIRPMSEVLCISSQGWKRSKQMNLLEKQYRTAPCCLFPGGPHSTPLNFHPVWLPHLCCQGLLKTILDASFTSRLQNTSKSTESQDKSLRRREPAQSLQGLLGAEHGSSHRDKPGWGKMG